MPPRNSIKEFKEVSKRASSLLDKEESFDVDFKRTVGSIETKDLVAFANSAKGGAILIGVDECKDENGQQKGKIIGCPTGDQDKLGIISKAEACTPTIDIEIYIENKSKLPFFRVEIKSGSHKPYCTNNGTYTIRHDGRNVALTPNKLLQMYLEEQGNQFIERFTKATTVLEEELKYTQQELENLDDEIGFMRQTLKKDTEELQNNIDYMSEKVESQLSNIFDTAENANSLSDDAMNYSMEAVGEIESLQIKVENIEGFVYRLEDKLDAVLEHFSIEDPNITRARNRVKSLTRFICEKFGNDNDVVDKIINRYDGYDGIDPLLLNKWIAEELELIWGRRGKHERE